LKYVTLATDGVSRWLQALRKGTPDGDRGLSVRSPVTGVTREGRQSRSMLFYQSRNTSENRYVRRLKSILRIIATVHLPIVPEIFCHKRGNL